MHTRLRGLDWAFGRRLATLMLTGLALTLATPTPGHAEELPPDCGEFTNSYGPFDYTNPDHFAHKLSIVEKFHFRPEQELSTYKPNSKVKVDFGYTLRAFPNHHRALMALARWLKLHKPEDWTSEMRPECYFYRAVAWRPRDAVSRMIFGYYLHQNQRLNEAEAQYRMAVQIQPDYAEGHYNLGLLLADQKRWPESLAEAHRAYELKYPLPGLKNRLIAAKVWTEPAPIAKTPAFEPVSPDGVLPGAVSPETVVPEAASPQAVTPESVVPKPAVTELAPTGLAPTERAATKPAPTEGSASTNATTDTPTPTPL